MPVYINNKNIQISLTTAKHASLKDGAALLANTASVMTNILGGVANLATAIGGMVNYIFMQSYFGLSNRELRNKIIRSRAKYKQLKADLKTRGYSIKLEKPNGLQEFGLHSNNCSTAGSTAIAFLNLGMQVGAMVSAIYTDVTNYHNDTTRIFCHDPNRFQNQTINVYCDTINPSLFDHCIMGSCIASYTLFGGVVAVSTLEQHLKRVNLERWSETLDEGVMALENIRKEIEMRPTVT